jgi:Tfp pilus assembly protein PilX
VIALTNSRPQQVIHPRNGAALIVVIVLIGLFAALCQTLVVLAAMQHRQAFDAADRAQAQRLADAGLLRAVTQVRRDPAWTGESWKPTMPGGETVAVELKIDRTNPNQTVLAVVANFQPSSGRPHQMKQTLTLVETPAGDPQKSSLP